MLEFSDWTSRLELPAKPWLVVGPGPTFACHRQIDRSAYNVLGSGSGDHASFAGGGSAPGSRSWSAAMSSAPVTPSMAA